MPSTLVLVSLRLSNNYNKINFNLFFNLNSSYILSWYTISQTQNVTDYTCTCIKLWPKFDGIDTKTFTCIKCLQRIWIRWFDRLGALAKTTAWANDTATIRTIACDLVDRAQGVWVCDHVRMGILWYMKLLSKILGLLISNTMLLRRLAGGLQWIITREGPYIVMGVSENVVSRDICRDPQDLPLSNP